MQFKICIVGMGLMGASLAQALHGFKNAQIVGVDTNEDALQTARQKNMVCQAANSITEVVQDADLLIFCVYAKHIPTLLHQCLGLLKPGCIITDICGVKTPLYKQLLPRLPANIQYVGIHPMAGKERDGIENADPALYRNTNMLICPTAATTPNALQLMQQLAQHIGCARIETVPYDEHDAVIAYTSDLMHIASAGLCLHFPPRMNLAFTAGAYRDCTRVADINAEAWTELLLENRENTLEALDNYIDGLQSLRRAMQDEDPSTLEQLLSRAGNNKGEMLTR